MNTGSLQNLFVLTLFEQIRESIQNEPQKYASNYVKVIDGVRYLREDCVNYAVGKVEEEWTE